MEFGVGVANLQSRGRGRMGSGRVPPNGEFLGLPYRLFLYQHWLALNFRLEFWVELRIPDLGEEEAIGVGDGIPFKRALVSSNMPSIATFPLSSRVSDILPLLCSSTPLFPTPPLVSPKFSHVSLRVGGWPLG